MQPDQSCNAARTATLSVRHFPVSLFGSVAGVAWLALAWRRAGGIYADLAMLAHVLAVAAVLLFLLVAAGFYRKAVMHPAAARDEFNSGTGTGFGMIGISMLLVARILGGYSVTLHLLAWGFGSMFFVVLSAATIFREGRSGSAGLARAWLMNGVGCCAIMYSAHTSAFGWAHDIKLLAGAAGIVSAGAALVLSGSHRPLQLARCALRSPLSWENGFALAVLTEAAGAYSVQPAATILLFLLTALVPILCVRTLSSFMTSDRNHHG